MLRTALATFGFAALLVIGAAGAAGQAIGLHVVSSTGSTVTLGWTPAAGTASQHFKANGKYVSWTRDTNRTTITFSKNVPCFGQAGCYVVEEQTILDSDSSSGAAAAGDTTPPTAPPALVATNKTQTSLTFGWGDATDNVGVVSYRIYRDGVLIGQGPGTSGGFSNSWDDTGRTCGASYLYGVEAQDAAGNTSPRSTLTVKMLDCSEPPPGNTVEFSGTVTASSFLQQINAAPAGPVTARPVAGQSSFTVTGSVALTRNVTIQHATIPGLIEFLEASSGSTFEDGRIWEFHIYGADNVTIQRTVMDGQNTSCNNNRIYDHPAGHVPDNWVLRDDTFRNYYCGSDTSIHTEALYIGYSQGGRIEGSTFENNGSTGHIFFTYWGDTANPSSSWPRNVCVTGNTFLHVINPYYAIQGREEIGGSANITIAPNNTFTDVPSPNGSPKVLAGGFSFKTAAC